jgi:hypothetical protein
MGQVDKASPGSGLGEKDNENYKALKAYGHSPAKALEICLDARRHNHYAQRHIDFVRKVVQ